MLLPPGDPCRRGLRGLDDRSASRDVSRDGPSGLLHGTGPLLGNYLCVLGRKQALSVFGGPHAQRSGWPRDETRAAREPLPVRLPVREEAGVVLDSLRKAA